MIPAGFESGYPGGEEHLWCARREGAARTLCGRMAKTARAAGFWPVEALQPSDPVTGCPKCLARLEELATPQSGVCPACGQQVGLVEGRIDSHGGCIGADLRPRGRR